MEGLEGTRLARALRHVDELVAAIVALAGVALAVLVLHDRAERVQHGLRGEVLARNQHQRVALPRLLALDNVKDLGVGRLRVCGHE